MATSRLSNDGINTRLNTTSRERSIPIVGHECVSYLAPVEAGIGAVPTLFFNAMDGSAADDWRQLDRQMKLVRQYQVERLQRFVALSVDLVTNADAARIQQARVAIETEMKSLRKHMRNSRPAFARLIKRSSSKLKMGIPVQSPPRLPGVVLGTISKSRTLSVLAFGPTRIGGHTTIWRS
ncbi:hypothetical protein [Pararhizobium sp. DWP3-4]|uniref:hypothetical protein n=1 Tax=Pararhizobium sp. DWP3-4 TaxID=2804565 RepID=UPI003CF1FE4E